VELIIAGEETFVVHPRITLVVLQEVSVVHPPAASIAAVEVKEGVGEIGRRYAF
jgi:hypothetical protein